MTLRNPPAWLQYGSHSAANDRLMIQSLVANSGVAGPYDLYVQQTAAPSMAVEVTAGAAFIYGTQLANQGVYHCYNDAPEIVTIAPASGQYPRKDIVVLRVYDAEVSGIESTSRIEVVAGSASVVPLAPPVPANSLLLATVDVPAGASQISGVNISTNRVRAKSGLASDVDVVTSATRPTLSYTGQQIFESDTGAVGFWDGSRWLMRDNKWQVWSPFRVFCGSTQFTANQIVNKYFRTGKMVTFQSSWTVTGAVNNGQLLKLELPFYGKDEAAMTSGMQLAIGTYQATRPGVIIETGTLVIDEQWGRNMGVFLSNNNTNALGTPGYSRTWTNGVNVGDVFRVVGTYEME